MAGKIYKKSTKVTRLDRTDTMLSGYEKIYEETVYGSLLTLFTSAFGPPIVMIDNDPNQRYTIMTQHIVEAALAVGIRNKMKGERHVNPCRN